MLSAWDFRNLSKKFNSLKSAGIRNYLKLDPADNRRIMIDSGGFKGYSQDFDLSIATVLKIYDAAQLSHFDHVIALDRAPLPFEDPKIRKEKIASSNQNYTAMKAQNSQVLPVIHGWTPKEINLSLSPIVDQDLISFPSYFTLLTNNKKDKAGKVIKISPHASFAGYLASYYRTSEIASYYRTSEIATLLDQPAESIPFFLETHFNWFIVEFSRTTDAITVRDIASEKVIKTITDPLEITIY